MHMALVGTAGPWLGDACRIWRDFMSYTLKNISTRLNKIAAIISQVIHLDVEIADSDLFRITGTGKLKHKVNRSMAHEGHAYSIALRTGLPQIISNPGLDPICQSCNQRHVCKETFEISYPIKIDGEVIGVIGLLAYTKQQHQRLQKGLASYCDFLEKISELIAFDVRDLHSRQGQELTVSILEMIQNDVNLGIMTMDANNRITLINQQAKALLNAEISPQMQAVVEDLSKVNRGVSEYRLHIGARSYQVLGSLYHTNLREYSSILMFHENRMLALPAKSKPSRISPADPLSGKSAAIAQLRQQIEQVAYFKVSVMILAEPGLEVCETARAIHERSILSTKRFYELNCAAYPPEELYALLFGSPGLLEKAAGQCLFLRNVDRLSMPMQHLLRDALESGTLAVGSQTRKLHGGVRILSSCERDLEALVQGGGFLRELYYALTTHIVRIPPLRERGNDVILLSKLFLRQQKSLMSTVRFQYDNAFAAALLNYSWPGNLPELKNVMHRLSILHPEATVLTQEMLPEELRIGLAKTAQGVPAPAMSEEERAIRAGLEKYGQSVDGKQRLADELGIGIATLYRKIKKYHLHE